MLRAAALLLLVGLLGVGIYFWKLGPGPAPPGLRGAQRQLEDVALTGAVKTALSLHRGLQPYGLSVSTDDGVVTLRGELASAELKEAALRVAGAVPDVRQGVDHLELNPSLAATPDASDARTLGERLDDETLAARVRMAFALDRGLRDAPLRVEVFKKEVRLSGPLPSEAARRLALERAGAVTGVRGVRGEQLVAAAGGSGEERRAAAERAIRANPNLDHSAIHVQLVDGEVVLKGRVRTGAERDLAALLARDAAQGVRNTLEIRP
jgi:osmotically-inducible protein OsmY